MKLTKMISAMMVATSLAGAMVVATPNLTAQAKTKMSLKTIPKQFRGTWYHYEQGKYLSQKISAKKLINHGDGRNYSLTMHQLDLNKKATATKDFTKNPHKWMFAYKSGNKVVMQDWPAYYALDKKDRGSYQVTTRTYKGKKVKVLKVTLAASGGMWYIYSPSKVMAKHLWNLDNK
ncbi:hypothetical protein [Lactiplantibacillus mudanjiangensis]|uniref:Uncharacterized protein n=1 Tax=Lactiplantibacillus mudanjiangensis TaxID=1296538 RepID=A0A660DWQ4_9LACO|nr:hypothetical protein [Lactiplantibacillus mudanjiangensis]VDG17507.1 hypothetical protein [Lactobacillus koreensis] [Lactiplantibacillus mudanjiangensis]VDG24685.1 hypothetical protein [Lactobacillus koreensis] [Lactiplantibacillus mudanjiangensis]VDG27710.1 hypothetical protein [Lactobacillus koreensis] [Lactiplantibacillus mudanjiangensis]VDG32813.1 hypothetical protein [Lactobacillus koreensis] [Lactiplantibacillus mudanjiangensis]